MERAAASTATASRGSSMIAFLRHGSLLLIIFGRWRVLLTSIAILLSSSSLVAAEDISYFHASYCKQYQYLAYATISVLGALHPI